MHKIKDIVTRVLAHPTWAGVGVLVAIIAFVVSLYDGGAKVLVPDNRELDAPIKEITFVSQRVALVVGNANYNIRSSIPSLTRGIRINNTSYDQPFTNANLIASLRNPVNDAKLVAKILKSKGFKVITGFNLAREELTELIDKYQIILSTGGIGVFYYSGHAINVRGEDYILPITTKDVSSEKSYISEAINVTQLLNPVEKLIEQHPEDTGSLMIYSASRGRPALDGSGENSPFTEAFAESLTTDDKGKGLFELFVDIARITTRKTQGFQTPWISGTTHSNFFFDDKKKDQGIGLLKVIFIDACRDNPFGYNR